MLKYILNGQHIEVIPEHMEIFEAQNPTAKLMDEAYLAEKMGSEKMAKDILPTLTLKTPEIDPDAPLSSQDFYSILSEDKEEEKIEEKAKVEQTDFRLLTEDEEEEFYPSTETITTKGIDGEDIKIEQPITFEKEDSQFFSVNNRLVSKEEHEGHIQDTESLEAWLNEEYFGKGIANQAISTNNLTAYQINNPNLGDLKKDFRSNLDNFGLGRTAFPNLSNSNLDDIFANVFSARVRAEQGKEGEKDQRIKVNDILSKKEKDQTDADAIETSVDKLDNAKINSNKNKLEAEFAQNVKKLRGELTDDERTHIENYLDPETPGSLGDRLFNKDEVEYNITTRMMVPTGKRIPKDEKYEIFHNPITGQNVNETEARVIDNNGGTVVNVTDAYDVYLTRFKNTSQDDLAKFNSQLILEEAGYNMENEEIGDYYVGDKTMRGVLRERGYESDGQGVFKDVPLGVLTQLSHVPGKWDFWSPDVYMSRGEIIPQDFKDKPYKNEEEFVEFLQTRRKQDHDIAAKNAALWQTHYLNRDISTISKNRSGQFWGAFSQSLFGENITAEQFQPTNQKIIDTFGNQILAESGVDVTEQQNEIFERTFADEATEAGGGLTAMLMVLHPVNKAQKALGINKMIAGLSAPRYVKGGKSISQSQATIKAAAAGKTLTKWADDTGHIVTKASNLRKGIGLATLGIYEDIKMREVLGTLTEGRMEFERGVGFGFALMPKVIPYGFGRFAQGKKFNLTTGNNQFNTFLQSTFVNAPSFALAVEGGDAMGAIVKDLQGKEEIETWASHHWSDRDKNMRRIGLNLITGKALGAMHFNSYDIKTTTEIGKFQRQSTGFIAKDYERIQKIADANNVELNEFIENNPNHKEVQKLNKHWEDFHMATQRLDLINNSAEWTDPAKAKKTYENHYKPLTELFKSKGKEIKIEVTDKPIYQDVFKNGKVVPVEVSALYTRLGTGKNKNIATIQINTKKAKGKQWANHEQLHAYLDIMFEGNIKLKEQFTNSFKEALKSIKTPGGNLYLDILKTKDIKEIDKLEEMMAYSSEYLGKAEYYNALVGNQAFTKVKKFWNNFAESTLGLKADLTLKQDIIDLLGTYGKTGDIRKLEGLNEIIEYDPTGKAREGQVATTDINKTVKQIETRKTDILQEIKDLRTAKPKGYEDIIKEKTTLFNELNTNQTKLENKAAVEAVDVAKKGEWKNQIDKNYTTGKHKTKEDFQKSLEFGKVSNDILISKGLDNMVRQAATKVGVAEGKKDQFVSDVKDRILERFLKNYDPGKINAEYGRALTPFEYLTTGQKGGTSIIYRSAGDIMNKYKETVETISYDVFEKGAEAFTTEYGYTKSTDATGSKVEQEGIIVSDALKLPKSVEQKAAEDVKNLDFETIKAKEKVSYKNIDKNSKVIEKDIVVDYYGVSPEMYKKMQKSAAQQLNNPDINAIQNKIKENIETHVKLLPHGLQVIIDPITGENVALKTVAGVPSEAKATGTTTVLLRNPLLYKEIKQTGTKGSKYEYSDRLKEYHKTLDPVVKKKFEQDVLDSWGMGETQLSKAQLSGIYKGIMTQTRKAVYVQSVNKQLPKTPELTMRFALANMINQVSAGKSPKLATLGELVNEVRKNIDSNFMPSLSSFQTLFKGRNFDKYRKNGNIDLFMDQWNKIEYRIHGFEKSIEKQAEIMYEGRIIERSELKAIEAKNFKDMANKLKKQGGIFKDINTNEGLYDWSKSSTAIAKQNIFETALGNKYPAGKEGLVLTALGNGKNKRWNPITEKMELISHPKGYEKTINNWFETRLGEKWTGNGKSTKDAKFAWMNDVVIKDTGDVKTKLANENIAAKNTNKTEVERIEIIHRQGREMMAGKTKDFNKVLEANKKLRLFHLNSIKDIIDNHAKHSLTKIEAIQAALRHVRHQTDITNGPIKGTATITAATIEVGIPVGKNEAAKNYLGTMYHAEHQMQLMNHSYTFFNSIGKNKGNKKGFKSDMERLANLFEQSITVKQDQLIYDSPLFGGNTTYLKAFKGKNLGEVSSILNIMYRPGVASTMVDLKSKTPQTIAETILQNYNKRQLDILLKESAKLGEPNALHYNLKLKNNTRNVEIQNRDILSRSIGKKMAKTVASKDINKVIKIVDKALENGRKIKKETKGASVWDLDDTLIHSKSGVRARIPNPSGKPKPNRKVVFLAGGAGSGKGNVIKKLNLEKQGFKIVNQDISLEWLKKNHGLPENMNELTKEQRSTLGKLQHQARQIAKDKMMKYKGDADGVVVDGTGGSIKAMEKLVNEFKDKGYDVSMVFVETSLKTALERNRARAERSLLDKIVEKNHEAVQGNKPGFKTMFGERFMEVKTDNLKQGDAMPADLVSKVNDFVSGYEKIRLDAEQFATQGKEILDRGGKFDFTEFNVVTGGEKGPFFQKALDRVKKYGPENNFILTARPPEAQTHIHEFLKSQGLEIPLKNIKGLGNSTAEAKAAWMLEKFAEGYNDIYFADDAMQNVKAVREALGKLDVKSKVVQAKVQKEKALNEVKDVDKLDSPDTYGNVLASKKIRSEYERTIAKHRPDLVKEGLVSKTVDEMFDFIDTLNVPANKKKKYEQVTTKWLATSNIKLKEDAYKVRRAVELAEKHKEDIFSYRNPNEIIEKYAGKSKAKPTNPKTVKEFRFSGSHKEKGISIYEVENTKEGQKAVRKVIDTHWGIDSNPWCITQAKKGKLTDDAWQNWTVYEKGPKRIVFHNGKLSSFYANRQYWDRMDNATDAPTVTIKKGNVTSKVELVPYTEGGVTKIQEFVRETRTVSKDKKTVTTEILAESQDGYEVGTKIIENRVNGITVKSTRSRPSFDKQGNDVMHAQEIINFDKSGKATSNITFDPSGNTMAINTHFYRDMSVNDIVMKKGDLLSHEVNEAGFDYYHGDILLNGKIIEIGWQAKEGTFDLKNAIKTVDGKVRADLKKILEVDTDAMTMPPGKTPVKLGEVLKSTIKPQVKEGMQALEPVKKVLDQLDAKSEVQQTLASKNLNKDVNKIMEQSLGINSKKKFSKAEAKVRGKDIKRRRVFMRDSAADLELLIEPLYGKGKEGIENKKWFNKEFVMPFERGIRDYNTARQSAKNDYINLRKQNKDVVKDISKEVEGTTFTNDMAMRVYLWNKAGYKIPDLAKTTETKLVEHIQNNPKLQAYAEQFARITKQEKGLKEPGQNWWGETMAGEVTNINRGVSRKQYLQEWIDVKNEIFTEENLNKMESKLGTEWRENSEDMFDRMETGRTRSLKLDRGSAAMMNYLNGGIGTIMNFNTRSAALQTISTTNFLNMKENNPIAAARAMGNVKQFSKDFMYIMNSDMLKQRRDGLAINVTEAEIASAAASSTNMIQSIISKVLKAGYIPTKLADSFAISLGGATFYRNRIKMYEKQGMKTKEAEKQAWLDFQVLSERTQQSSRADLLSKQQTSLIGRFILPFANTPMQMNRAGMKDILDISKGRYKGGRELTEKVGRISYYMGVQIAIFAGLQSALFAMLLNDDDVSDEKIANTKSMMLNTTTDSMLRGFGIQGAIISAFKNATQEYFKQSAKGYSADYSEVAEDLLNMSPPIGSKFGMLDRAGDRRKWAKIRGDDKFKFELGNPSLEASLMTIQATTNAPVYSPYQNMFNLKHAMSDQYETWQRFLMGAGWTPYSVGVGVETEKKKEKPKKKKGFGEKTYKVKTYAR